MKRSTLRLLEGFFRPTWREKAREKYQDAKITGTALLGRETLGSKIKRKVAGAAGTGLGLLGGALLSDRISTKHPTAASFVPSVLGAAGMYAYGKKRPYTVTAKDNFIMGLAGGAASTAPALHYLRQFRDAIREPRRAVSGVNLNDYNH